MKKKILIPVFILACAFFLTGCSKVSLTGSNTVSTGGAPTNGDTPPSDIGTPPDGGTSPNGDVTPPNGPSEN